MLRMNCLWPKSPLRATPILTTYSLCGCTVESLPQQMLSSPSPSSRSSSCSSRRSSRSSSRSSCSSSRSSCSSSHSSAHSSSRSPRSSSRSSRSMSPTLVLSAVVRLHCSAATLPHAPHIPPHAQPCYMVKSATARSTLLAVHHTLRHHPSQQLYCGEFLP